uniref:VOC domain-containing protein n=1 Tax=Rhabditophanes sp. KR3021 TaxID=114890 RepID=A0AC35U5C0_9BILA
MTSLLAKIAGRGVKNVITREASTLFSLGKLNHVAIAVPDLEKASKFYKQLGADVSEAVAQPDHGVYTVFINLGNSKIELLHPFGEKSPIAPFLAKNKDGGMHHICIEVPDIHVAIEKIRSMGIRTLGEKPKIGAHGKLVMFLHPKDCNGTLMEIEEV